MKTPNKAYNMISICCNISFFFNCLFKGRAHIRNERVHCNQKETKKKQKTERAIHASAHSTGNWVLKSSRILVRLGNTLRY